MKVFYTVNSGLIFQSKNYNLIVDGIHLGKKEGFSNSPKVISRFIEQKEISALVFSHNHPDHYDLNEVNQILKIKKDLIIVGPKGLSEEINSDGYYEFCNDYECEEYGPFKLHFFKAAHLNPAIHTLPNGCFIIEVENNAYLLTGDTVLNNRLKLEIKKNYKNTLDGMFITPYHNTKEDNEFLKDFNINKVFLIHRPLKEDDIYMYNRQALIVSNTLDAECILPTHMDFVEL